MILENESLSSMGVAPNQQERLEKYIEKLKVILRYTSTVMNFSSQRQVVSITETPAVFHTRIRTQGNRRCHQRTWQSKSSSEDKKASAAAMEENEQTAGAPAIKIGLTQPKLPVQTTHTVVSCAVYPGDSNCSAPFMTYCSEICSRTKVNYRNTNCHQLTSKSCTNHTALPAHSSRNAFHHSKCPGRKKRNLSGICSSERSGHTASLIRYLIVLGLILMCENSSCYAYPPKPYLKNNMQSSPHTSSKKPINKQESFLWPSWLEDPIAGSKSSETRSRRQERAAKRGIPRELLNKHEYLQRLYSRNGFFLEILKNGRVRGTLNRNSSYNLLRFESLAVGVLAIYGTKSRLYLAMNKKGNLYGSKKFTYECKFSEKMADGRYFTYQAVPPATKRRRAKKRKSMFVGFDKRGKAKRGKRNKGTSTGALFNKLAAKTTRRQALRY